MKKIIVISVLLLSFSVTVIGQSQQHYLKFNPPPTEANMFKYWKFVAFPSTDSMRSYNNKWITNNAATAFTNLRLHYLLEGIIDFLDQALAGGGGSGNYGIDSLAMLNDSTLRYRKNGSFRTMLLRGKNWNLQQVLNNGSTLTENETVTILDSLIFSTGKIILDSLRIRYAPSTADSTNKHWAMFDASGNMYRYTGTIGGGLPSFNVGPQQIAWGRADGGLGGNSGATYDTTAREIATDSLNLRYNMHIGGNINPGSSGFNVAGIRFGRTGDYYRNSDDATNSDGKLWIAYPKYACDTCTRNQPFYSDIGTTIYDVTKPANSVVNLIKFGSGASNKPMARIAMEQNYYDDVEIHLGAFKPIGDISEIRQISLLGNFNTGQSTGLFRFSAYNFTDAYAKHEYISGTPNGFNVKPVARNDGSVTEINLTPLDTPSLTVRGGVKLMTQFSGGEWVNTANWGGNQMTFNSNGLLWNSFTPGASNAGRNFIFSSTAGNTNRIMWVGNDWGGAYTQAYEVFASGNTVFGPNNTADAGYRLQTHGAGSQFASFTRTASTNTVTPAGYFWNTSTGSTIAGYGSSIALAAQARNNGFLGMSYLGSVYTDVTDGSEDADFTISNLRGASIVEALRSLSDGRLRINNTYTITNADGTANQVLTTNGSGTASWGTLNFQKAIDNGNTTTKNDTINQGTNNFLWSGTGDHRFENMNVIIGKPTTTNLTDDTLRVEGSTYISTSGPTASSGNRMKEMHFRFDALNESNGLYLMSHTKRKNTPANDTTIVGFKINNPDIAFMWGEDVTNNDRSTIGVSASGIALSSTGNSASSSSVSSNINMDSGHIDLRAYDSLRVSGLVATTNILDSIMVPIVSQRNSPTGNPNIYKIGVAANPGGIVLYKDSASGVSQLDLVFNPATIGTFDRIVIHIEKLEVATNDVELRMRFSSDNGSSFATGASDYEWIVNWRIAPNGTGVNGDDVDDHITLVQNISNGSGHVASGEIELLHPHDVSYQPQYKGEFITSGGGGAIIRSDQGGRQTFPTLMTAARLYLSSGIMDKIKYRVIGYRN